MSTFLHSLDVECPEIPSAHGLHPPLCSGRKERRERLEMMGSRDQAAQGQAAPVAKEIAELSQGQGATSKEFGWHVEGKVPLSLSRGNVK